MLSPADPSGYQESIVRPHQAVSRVTVLDGFGTALQEIDFVDGAVTASMGSQVTRSAQVLINPALSPQSDTDLLFPNGNRLLIERGIDYGCGADPDLLPVFHGRIQSVEDVSAGLSRIRAVDLSADVRDAGFIVPTNSVATNAIGEEFRRLVKGALPSAQFGPSDSYAAAVGARTWDVDRAQALDDMADSVASLWWTLADGRFVIRRVPWTVAAAPVMIFTDLLTSGDCPGADGVFDPGGRPWLTVTDSVRTRSRETVANIVTVAAEHTDGSDPIVHTASDDDPGSVTWIGGPFGVKSRHIRTDVARTGAQVVQMAESELRQSLAILHTWGVRGVPDARVELGDPIRVACQRVVSDQVVVSLRMPLTVAGFMDIGLRAQNDQEVSVV